ncbi:pancreatic triacylglycerol lipase-like [Aplysia californica]|uniref:Pancreatic triacylglycerol lipase-like n=1 Tax=Aplysia californica TaxID=6500 RepID=A0ABM1A3Z8_APLCA|nr:pancreatic triacylglycerol lipase-like [Aplysia californica]
MVGHSLGSHIMGYAGKEIQRLRNSKLGRISGLDPAGPFFESYSSVVRVDKSDATFVDIMHTDAEALLDAGFGTRYSIGHVDFYPNGGEHQPGCPEETYGILSMISFEDEKEGGACSHGRAVDLFIHSINNCQYVPPTGGLMCAMGFITSPNCRGDHQPDTKGNAPFC